MRVLRGAGAAVIAAIALGGVSGPAVASGGPTEATRAPTVFTAWRGVQEFVVLRLTSSGEATLEYGVTLRCTHTDRPGTQRKLLVSSLSRVRATGGRLARVDSLPSGLARSTLVDMGEVRDDQMTVRVRITTSRTTQRCRADTTFRTRRATMPIRATPVWLVSRTGASPE